MKTTDIKKLRLDRCLTQTQFAEITGTSLKAVQVWEAGTVDNLRDLSISKIERGLRKWDYENK